ncbi:fibroblast growth factor 17 isoform X2 [Odontomachus brunneus]|uniref:fibroblast growth factor 17 isoform X2 n=1 Tax=Odontomachus brunneus TaxID=486640 RepID=UPI0013F28D08|nr:fibroblast growth factor 17 isoform X2 [Odontomachus brunneus]
MFVIRLPQLVVLAKILCILMVVMCGAAPTMVRSVSLHAVCSGRNVTVIGRQVTAEQRNDSNAAYQELTTRTEDFSKKLYIYAEKSQRYICFNKRWKLVGLPKEQKGPMCQFYEIYNDQYLGYISAVDKEHLMGFNSRGKPMKKSNGRKECYRFMKYNPHVDISHHNSLVNAQMSGMEPREPYVGSRKPSPVTRATKNSLSQADSARDHIQKPPHRQRHLKQRWKQRQNGKNSASRRRSENCFVEASK